MAGREWNDGNKETDKKLITQSTPRCSDVPLGQSGIRNRIPSVEEFIELLLRTKLRMFYGSDGYKGLMELWGLMGQSRTECRLENGVLLYVPDALQNIREQHAPYWSKRPLRPQMWKHLASEVMQALLNQSNLVCRRNNHGRCYTSSAAAHKQIRLPRDYYVCSVIFGSSFRP
jgi:hypothetical protein